MLYMNLDAAAAALASVFGEPAFRSRPLVSFYTEQHAHRQHRRQHATP